MSKKVIGIIKKGMEGAERPGHRYLRREGFPGHYRYIYSDSEGREYAGPNAPETHEHHDPNAAKPGGSAAGAEHSGPPKPPKQKVPINHKQAMAYIESGKTLKSNPVDAMSSKERTLWAKLRADSTLNVEHSDNGGLSASSKTSKQQVDSKIIHEDASHKVMHMHDHDAETPNQHKEYDPDHGESRTTTAEDRDFNYRIKPGSNTLHLIDKKANKVVGHMSLDSSEYENQVRSVHVDVQGKGHGSKLYEAAIKYSGKDGLTSDDAQEPGDIAIWNKLKNRKDLNTIKNSDGTMTIRSKNDTRR